ncbi:MAG: hypothetical protein ACRBBN_16550 [Methyloligellaceae bacterium]
MDIITLSLMHGMVYGLLTFLLAGILTLLLSLTGVLGYVQLRFHLLAGVALGLTAMMAFNGLQIAMELGNIVFVVIVLAGLRSLPGALIASVLLGIVQTYAMASSGAFVDVAATYGWQVLPSNPYYGMLSLTLPQLSMVLPFVLMVMLLIFRSQVRVQGESEKRD